MNPYVWRLTCQNTRILQGSVAGAKKGAVLCFSMMAPVKAQKGCRVLHSVGGYTELILDTPADFFIGFVDDEFEIFNREWLPKSVFLTSKTQPSVDVKIQFEPQEKPDIALHAIPAGDGLRIVPYPANWQPSSETLNSSNGFLIVAGSDFAKAILAVDRLAARNGLGEFLAGQVPIKTITDPTLAKESYILNLSPDVVTIIAATRTGAFYAAISLFSLHINHLGNIPCGVITDQPRFAWRGQQLDTARHFFQPETLFELLDLMAILKLNKFHWHFNDDETFRLEINSYPEIWQKTRLRGKSQLVPGVFGGGKGPTGGSYSLAFAQSLIKRAAELEIDILPEIEIPAHAYAITRVFPSLRDPDDVSNETSIQGYTANTMNPAMPFMWEFIKTLTAELAGIFPFAHIHLGCDERPVDAWKNSAKARELMQKHGLKTLDDLQGWTIEKAAAIVRGFGCQPCAWEEAQKGENGGIGNDAILFSWSGQGPGLAAARAGYRVVMCPGKNLYLDMAQGTGFDEFGGRWAGPVDLQASVNWQVIPDDEPELEQKILGVQGAFWTEFITHDTQMKSLIAPRILGVTEMGWRMQKNPATGASIGQSAADYSGLLGRMGWGLPS